MCPSTATITSFYSFTAGTKAKASEVNTNFLNYRGFLLPVNTDTTTASDNTHDLGAADHRWRYLYVNNPPVIATQTAGYFWGGPTSGNGDVPAFRALDVRDLPSTFKFFMFQNFS